MSAGPAAPMSSIAPDILSPDTVVGGRFRVETPVHHSALVTVVRAKDDKTNRPIALNLLTPQLVGNNDELNVVREEIKLAAKLKHRSMLGTYGVGTHGGKVHFVACEWVDGVTLDQLVQQRKAADHIISVRGAYNLLAHICKALASAHETTVHGAVRPGIVWVADNGKVKVGDFGLGLAMVKLGKWALLDRREQSFLAPEVHNGGEVDARTDVFGVGALLYVLLTGRSPDQEFVAPSRAHPDATEAVDQILLRCLASDPSQRYASPAEVIDALMPLVSDTQPASDADIGLDIEIDVDVAASVHPAAPAAMVQVQVPRSGKLPQPLSPAPAQAKPRPSPAPVMQAPVPVQTAPEPEARRSELDLHSLVAEIAKDDAPRWIANKEGLDYGPFSGRELVALIVKGEVLEQHSLVNLDTGERRTVREYPEFAEFVQQYKIRKAESDHQEALVKSDKVEKRANVAKFTFLAAGIGVLLLAGAAYLITRNKAAQEAANADANLAALYESGQVKITGTAGILKHTGGGGGRKRAAGGGGPGGGLSYEDAMNQAVDLGDAKSGGGERQLTSGDVAGVMNQRLNSLFGCVSEEIRRGGKLGNVKIDIAIAGSGSVLGTSVNAGSGAFQGCIAGKVRNIRFPSFPAPRMGARYSFNVD